jgi:hypothetical protein
MATKRWVKSKAKDKARKAKHPGRRVADSGSVYYENRLDRADVNRKVRLKKGGFIAAMNKKVKIK